MFLQTLVLIFFPRSTCVFWSPFTWNSIFAPSGCHRDYMCLWQSPFGWKKQHRNWDKHQCLTGDFAHDPLAPQWSPQSHKVIPSPYESKSVLCIVCFLHFRKYCIPWHLLRYLFWMKNVMIERLIYIHTHWPLYMVHLASTGSDPLLLSELRDSSEILVHIDMIASHSCCRFVGCTSMMRISRFTTSQSCSIGLRSGDCGSHFSKVNSLSCSRNQSEMTSFVTWCIILLEVAIRYTVVIKGWTWSETIFR